MTRSCFLGWSERCYRTDFSSQGSFHTVAQLPLHHSKMTFTKWLHILACVCLGFSGHSNMLLAGVLCQLPEAGQFHTKFKVYAIRPFTPLQSLSWANTRTDWLCQTRSITRSWKETRELNWSWEWPSQRCRTGPASSNEPPLQTWFIESYIHYLIHHSWCVLLSLPSGNSHILDTQKAEINKEQRTGYLTCK